MYTAAQICRFDFLSTEAAGFATCKPVLRNLRLGEDVLGLYGSRKNARDWSEVHEDSRRVSHAIKRE